MKFTNLLFAVPFATNEFVPGLGKHREKRANSSGRGRGGDFLAFELVFDAVGIDEVPPIFVEVLSIHWH